jgi:hypothetical protein
MELDYRVGFVMAGFGSGRIHRTSEIQFKTPFETNVRPFDANLQAPPSPLNRQSEVCPDYAGVMYIEATFRNLITCPVTITKITSSLKLFQQDWDVELAEGEQFSFIGLVHESGKQFAKLTYSYHGITNCEFEHHLCDAALQRRPFLATLTAPPMVVKQTPFKVVLTLQNLSERYMCLFLELNPTRGFISEGPLRTRVSLFSHQTLELVYTFIALYTSSTLLPQINVVELAKGAAAPQVLMTPIVVTHV